MKKATLFRVLYVLSVIRSWLPRRDGGHFLGGAKMFMFYDEKRSDQPHSVVAFVLPKGRSSDDYYPDLLGPFGYTSEINFFGWHLYGRDTWGPVEQYQIDDPRNKDLRELAEEYPGHTILLAGVRRLEGQLTGPLKNPGNFALEVI